MAMTIEDYKKMYEEARAAGDAAKMQAANDGANAIRASMGVAAEYANADIAKIASQTSGYAPINSYAAQNIDKDAYANEVKKQQNYVNANPSAVRTQSAQEKYDKYGDVIDSTVRTGYYTRDAAAAQAAADKYGVGVTPATYKGESGWYLVDRAKRPAQAGSSGADEGLLGDSDYAIVQKLKQDFADAQAQYNAAVAAGNTAAAASARRAMDDAHLEAERIRAGYNYSGGQDGSMYIDYFTNALTGGMDVNTDQTRRLLGAKGLLPDEDEDGAAGSGLWGSGAGGSGSGGWSGSWNGGAGTVPVGSDLTGMVEDYSDYLKQMYAARKEAALAELDAAYQSSLNALDRAEQGIGEQYQAARNSTAGSSEVAKRNFAEYAAASGLNSGTGGQAELARNVTLQNDLNTLDTAQADAISDLQLQRANAETQYNNAIAQAQAQGDYELASALYQEKVRVQNALLEMEREEQQYALQKYQLEYKALRDQVGDRQWAAQLARK